MTDAKERKRRGAPEKGPTTPAEESARKTPDHVLTPDEKAKVAKEASRQEDA